MTAPVAILDGKPVTAAELDALVATQVLGRAWDESRCRVCGWTLDPKGDFCRPDNCSMRPYPTRRADEWAHYSTDIAAAWTVVTVRADWLPSLTWQCGIFRGDDIGRMGWFCDFRSSEHHGYAAADTAPLAICLAALLAVGACKTAEAIPAHPAS